MIPPILERVRQKGYRVFTDGDYNLNLIGLRSQHRRGGKFDDLLVCSYREGGEWCVHWWEATTDPGLTYLRRPMNKKGCAILVPGQYQGAFMLGLHGRTRYEGLVQVRALPVYRDNNLDGTLDMDESSIDVGMHGINIHASDLDPYNVLKGGPAPDRVGPWSAGCQVFKNTQAFRQCIALVKLQETHRGWKSLTYTLLEV